MSIATVRPRTLEKYRTVLDACQNGCLSNIQVVTRTGLSRSVVYRALQYYGIRLERQRPIAPKKPVAPFNPKPCLLPALDPIWKAEFRGLFYGEGCIRLANRAAAYTPRMTITLRLDDREILEDVYAKLGGNVRPFEREDCNPQMKWTANGWRRCRAITEEVFLDCLMPAKKTREIELCYEAILARYQMPYWPTEENYKVLASFFTRLTELKQFSF